MYTYIFFQSIKPNRTMSDFGSLWQQKIVGRTCSSHSHGMKVVPVGLSWHEPGAEETATKFLVLLACCPSGQAPITPIFFFFCCYVRPYSKHAGKKTPVSRFGSCERTLMFFKLAPKLTKPRCAILIIKPLSR